MADEGLDPILIQVTIPLPVPMIYSALVDPGTLSQWLCQEARVGSGIGDQYELTFSEPRAFTSAGKILQRTKDLDLGFSWNAPPEFGALMNSPASPSSQVYLRLQESPEGVDITLEHSGWGAGGPWEEARSWHFHFWEERLERLKDHLIKAAYG